jgi:hypothetical protein
MTEALQGAAASFGFIFVAAGVAKFDNWRDWNDTLRNLLPRRVAARGLVARALPTSEIAVGALALVRPPIGSFACGALLLGLGSSAAYFSFSHRGEACNCFGAVMPSQIGPRLAIRNIALGATALGVAWYAARRDVPGLGVLEVAAAILGGVLLLSLLGLTEFRDIASRKRQGVRRWA